MNSNGTQYGAMASPAVIHFHRLMPIAILYFFFNSVGLPTGLFYTTILSPLLFVWLYLQGKRWVTTKFAVCLLPFIVAHLSRGVESDFYYARSILLLWTVVVTTYAFYIALVRCKNLTRLFEQLIILNFYVAAAAVALLFTPFSGLAWNHDSVGVDATSVLRLRLLTSEPSVYAQLMAPLLVFAGLRVLLKPGKRNAIYAGMIVIPFLLSQSFGGLSICAAGIGVALLVTFRRQQSKRKILFALVPAAIFVGLILIIPNPISLRIAQVISGADSSTHSRTDNGFIVAYAIAASKSIWWGAGLGQAKLNDVSMLGAGFNIGIIPNSVAGTFAELGIVAVLVKFVAEIVLFFRTRVYGSTFRLAMFVIAFLYQFTGSTLMNVQEYVMWGLAFGPFFLTLNYLNSNGQRVNIARLPSVAGLQPAPQS